MIEPRVVQRLGTRRVAAQPPADQVAVAQAMTRQAAALRTAVANPVDAQQPTEHWYRVEDPFTTAETDAAFAAFMAGDNPHLRTDEVPVVDFTSMIEQVGADGRPVSQSSQRETWIKAGLAALVATVALAAAAAFGFVEIPGTDGLIPEAADQPASVTAGD